MSSPYTTQDSPTATAGHASVESKLEGVAPREATTVLVAETVADSQ